LNLYIAALTAGYAQNPLTLRRYNNRRFGNSTAAKTTAGNGRNDVFTQWHE
jgi:hypothetical protein